MIQGQGAHRRVAVASVGVIALVLVGLGVVALVGDGADDGAPGVPSRMYAVPDHVVGDDSEGESLGSDLARADLRVGPAAATWEESSDITVVVGAEDGAYHLVDRLGLDVGALVLSPDGRRILQESADGAIAITDLTTGETTYVRGIRVQRPAGRTRLAWSPDGSWAAWSGPSSTGRVRVASGDTNEIVPTAAQRTGALTVADDGSVLVVSQRGVTRFAQDGVTTTGPLDIKAQLQADVRSSADGTLVAVGSCCTKAAYVVDTVSGEVVTRAALDFDGYLATAQPVGWLDATTSLWQVMPQGGGGDGSLVEVTVDGSTRTVGEIDDHVPDTVSVATGLMTPERATVDRPAPDWPWSPVRHLVVWGSAAALLAIGGSFVLARRRVVAGVPAEQTAYGGPPALVLGTIGAAAVAGAWMALVLTHVSGDSTGLTYLFAGPVALVVAGIAMLFDRRRRWWGAGLVVGPPIALGVLIYLALMALGG